MIAVMAKRRPAIPTATQTELLRRSRRRCCICFGLNGDIGVKKGQIAHLDQDRSNVSLDNLSWLCVPHHDDYDSIPRQTKGLTAEEVKSYRNDLYRQTSKIGLKVSPKKPRRDLKKKSDPPLTVLIRYCDADIATTKVIAVEITTRIEKIYQFTKIWRVELEAELDNVTNLNLKDTDCEKRQRNIFERIRLQIGLPQGIRNLDQLEGPVNLDWRSLVKRLAKKWAAGILTYEECVELYWEFQEPDFIDYHYVLFGLPYESLTRMQDYGLEAFIYQHGQRKYVSLPQQKTRFDVE